jgi:prevent-host-death family protein
LKTSISAADANRQFSKLLHGVREGRSYVVTSHGEPVAEIAPIDQPKEFEISARHVLLKRLRRQTVSQISSWKRDELYEDER